MFEDLVGGPNGVRVHSKPSSQGDEQIELHFFLTPTQVEELERRRHAAGADVFSLYFRLEPTVVDLKNLNVPRPGQSQASTVLDAKYGQYAELAVFWTTNQPSALRIDLEVLSWVRNVLPGLGYDRVRLVEVTLPPPLPDQPGAASEFDKAKAALDGRRYECRLPVLWDHPVASHMGPLRVHIDRRR